MSPSRRPTKMRRQRRRQQDLPELLRRRELEAAADVDQHRPRAGEPFERLQDHRRQPGGEADHHDRRRAAAEDHQEQRIHQHDRRRGERRHPGLGGEPQTAGTGSSSTPSAMPTTLSSRLAPSASPQVCRKRCSTCSSTMIAAEARQRSAMGSGTMKRLMSPARISTSTSAMTASRRRDAERDRTAVPRSQRRACHRRRSPARATRDSSSLMPRLASSRRSLQICAT